jgi:4-amino-4-deoxy-L-arabinose transferase-like glycosyltransferase
LVLGAVLAVGIAARCRQYAGCPSYWYDEAYLLLNVFDRGFAELLGPLRYRQAAPPAFLWSLRGLYELGGGSEWVMRLPALLSGLAGLALMVPLARSLVGGRGWVWAVAFCALSNHAVSHGCEVKPYATDFLVTAALLLGAAVCLRTDGPRGWALAGVALAAPLAPWFSFPSVYVAAAAGLALLAAGVRRRSGPLTACGLVLGALLAVSAAALWYATMRYQNSRGLHAYWADYFPSLSSPKLVLRWTAGYLADVGQYGTAGMGVPLAVLMALGTAVLWWRSRALAVLVAGPLVLAWVGAALHRYPLGDRLLFFAVPCAWLLAAEAMAATVARLPRRATWAATAVLAALLLPGTLARFRDLAVIQAKAEFRQAFAFIERHRAAADRVMVQHVQVYEVYHGPDPALVDWEDPPGAVRQAVGRGRLWLVFAPTPDALAYVRDLSRCGRVLCGRRGQCGHFRGLKVALYEPTPAAADEGR